MPRIQTHSQIDQGVTAQSRRALDHRASVSFRPKKVQRGVLGSAEFSPIESRNLPQLLPAAGQMA
jgi:hypothetical protein